MKINQALIHDIDHTQPGKGELVFWWLGQMGFVVKTCGKVLYFDPFLAPRTTRLIPPLLEPQSICHADYVLTTHNHSDHTDPIAITGIAQGSPQAKFLCSRVTRNKILSLGVDSEKIVGLDDGEDFQDSFIKISAIAAQHEFFDRDQVLGFPHLIFVVQVGDLTILHAGDTLCYDGLVTKLGRWKFDLIFLPINGRDAVRYSRKCLGNMTYQEAVDLAGNLHPRLVVPGHYDMFANNSENPQLFADYIAVKYPSIAYWIGEHGEPVFLDAYDRTREDQQ